MRNIESICTLRILCSKYTVSVSCYCCYYHHWFFRSTSLPLYVYSLKFCGQTSYFGMQFYLGDHTQHSCRNYLDLFLSLLLFLKPLRCFLSNFKPLEVSFSAYILISNAYAAWSQGLYFFMTCIMMTTLVHDSDTIISYIKRLAANWKVQGNPCFSQGESLWESHNPCEKQGFPLKLNLHFKTTQWLAILLNHLRSNWQMHLS